MKPLPYGRQWIDEGDIHAVAQALQGEFLTTGPLVERFESALAQRCSVRHAVVVSSGTAALHAAYYAAGVRGRSEVITTPLTFAATASTAVLLGANPVFADIDVETLCLDPKEVEKNLTKQTKVIAPVDYAGQPAAVQAMCEIARGREIVVVEDASHALGATLDGCPVGSLADITVFSFHPVKHVTTGEGGAVLTNHAEFAQRARDFRNHGIVRDRSRLATSDGDWFYDVTEIGLNYRLTDVQCALGLSQLAKLDGFLARRRQIAQAYLQAFADDKRIILPRAREMEGHAWHLFPIRLTGENPPRRQVFDQLRGQGIGVQVHYVPVNAFSAYRALGYAPGATPKAYDAYQRLISLPIFPAMEEADIARVVTTVRQALSMHY